ncbi:hypothetical protein [Aestuariimicrobium sp. T2.26MG-19.2B]|uniref:hypothetical protein n=1 Tax=Aestuariimicrobium sp. T2.26MG-19.2B TaxID=3040679 RepID=UPI002477B6DD|nr:hypothetical protein [Aestuariimicrobium sp. T2.26MG-19.2B]CAI9400556.1 hypothetical protein AESSP_00412 [Aestuariimicrobium sp. T2.26MG-19.2B]
MSDITSILEDLAAGRIDAAEAAHRIEAAKAASPTVPDPDELPPQEPSRRGSYDELDGGRPQFASHARESFRRSEPDDSSGQQPSRDQEPSGRRQSSSTQQPAPEVNLDEVPESAAAEPGARPAGSKGVDRVVVRATGRRVRIIGDPKVATLSADGPHVLRRTGRVLEVTSDGDLGPSLDGFSIVRPPKSLDDLRSVGLGKALTLRVNPAIAVDAEVTAGSLKVVGVPVLGKIRVTAGSASVTDVVEVNDALVQAGSASVEGPLKQGRSRVRVESGSLSVKLTEGANVTIKADAHLGKVAWPVEGQVDEYVVGNGSARLDIGVVMGHASIKVDETDGN